MAPISKKKTSVLWTFFEPVDEYYAICNMCKSKFSYKTSTSNLKKHIQNRHPTVTFLKSAAARGISYENNDMVSYKA